MKHYHLVMSDGQNWLLHHETDPQKVLSDLDRAFADGSTAIVRAVPGDQPTGQVVEVRVNPRLFGWWAVMSQEPSVEGSGPTF